MILNRSLKIMEYFHATMILALFVPVLYAVAEYEDPAGAAALYARCLLVAVPVAVLDLAARHIRSLLLYIAACAALLAGIWGLTAMLPRTLRHTGGMELHETVYCLGMLLETLFVAALHFRDRIEEAKRKKGEDPLAAKKMNFLRSPALSMTAYFMIVYAAGILLVSKQLCDMAYTSAIVYYFLSLVYAYFDTAGGYLSLNKRTKGIPKRRLYGISAAMLFAFCCFSFIGMLPSMLLAGQRKYYNIRTMFDGVVMEPYEFEFDRGYQGAAQGGMDMMELLNDGQPPKEPSKLIMAVFWLLAAACIAGLIYGVIQFIRQIFKDFRDSLDENGDKIEELEDERPLYKEENVRLGSRSGYESEAQRIRRKYKKTIRRYRKDKPAPHESPAEMEELAGLKEDADMRELHKLYESARYGKSGKGEFPD